MALVFIGFLFLLFPLCHSFIGFTAFSPKTHLSPTDSFHRRVDESLAYLSFGLRSSLLPFPSQGIPSKPLEPTSSHHIPTTNSLTFEEDLTFPWKKSINPSRELVYMPMLVEQLMHVQELKMEEVPLSDHIALKQSKIKPARIQNLCFQNDKFRKIRMTYFDAGDNVQVFNTLWYPHYHYDLPLLGVDLISLGKNRVLTVVDFQPLHPTKEYFDRYISHLSTIRKNYPDLQGTLSGKIYNDTSFFSANMLFGRFSDESKLQSVVQPAFTEYLKEYLQLMDKAEPNYSPETMELVKQRHTAYDIYSALKDPAVGLFNTYFGKEWSDDFVHNFLFSLSHKPTHDDGSVTSTTPKEEKPVHSFRFDANGSIQPVISSPTSLPKDHHGST